MFNIGRLNNTELDYFHLKLPRLLYGRFRTTKNDSGENM